MLLRDDASVGVGFTGTIGVERFYTRRPRGGDELLVKMTRGRMVDVRFSECCNKLVLSFSRNNDIIRRSACLYIIVYVRIWLGFALLTRAYLPTVRVFRPCNTTRCDR